MEKMKKVTKAVDRGRRGQTDVEQRPSEGETEPASTSERPHPTVRASGSSSTKRVWGQTNPFDFAPSQYHKGLFRAVEPFLLHHRPGTLPAFNKFEGARMRRDALIAAARVLLSHFVPMESVLSEGTTEGNIRPLHIALLQGFKHLTRPSEDVLAKRALRKKYARKEVSGEDEESLATEAGIDHEDDVSGFVIKCEDQRDMSKSTVTTSSNEGIELDHEAPPQREDDVKGEGRTDFRLFVFDKSPLKRRDLGKIAKVQLSFKRLVSVVESKFDEEKTAVYQAAGYSRYELLRNLQSFHMRPVYLLVMAAKTWTYAILDVHGSIDLEENKISDKSFSRFQSQERACLEGANYEPISREDMNERLQMGVEYFRSKFKSKPDALFPNNKYLVGDFYVANEWYTLPTTNTDGGLVSSGCLHFYEGLLRIIIGDRVLGWTSDNVRQARKVQRILEEERFLSGGLELTLEEVQPELEHFQEHARKRKRSLDKLEDVNQ